MKYKGDKPLYIARQSVSQGDSDQAVDPGACEAHLELLGFIVDTRLVD